MKIDDVDWDRVISQYSPANGLTADHLVNVDITDDNLYQQAIDLAQYFQCRVINQVTDPLSWPFNETWLDQLVQKKRRVKQWLNHTTHWEDERLSYELFRCANSNIGFAREVVDAIAHFQMPCPDIEYFLHNLNASIDQIVNDQQIILRIKSLSDEQVKEMGGWRNTDIGRFRGKWIKTDIYRNADYYFDLGGGHNTPMISQYLNKEFTSLDIVPPNKIENIVLRTYKNRLDEQELTEYVDRLNDQKWIEFNFDTDDWPIEQPASIVIVSSGMFSATTAMLTHPHISDRFPKRSGKTTISYQIFKTIKMLTLAKESKRLELVTISRGVRYPLRYNYHHIVWEGGRMISIKSTERKNLYLTDDAKLKRHQATISTS